MSRNKILTSIKGHNSVTNLQKKNYCSQSQLDLVNINVYRKLVKFCQFLFKILSGNENITSIKGCYSAANMQKIQLCENPNLNLVTIDVHTKFCQILSIGSQDLEEKQN